MSDLWRFYNVIRSVLLTGAASALNIGSDRDLALREIRWACDEAISGRWP